MYYRPRKPLVYEFRDVASKANYTDFDGVPLHKDPEGNPIYAPPNPESFIDVFKKVHQITEQDLLDKFGMDVVMTLRLLRMLFYYFIVAMLLTAIVLYPVYGTGEANGSTIDIDGVPTPISIEGLGLISMSNVSPESPRFYATWSIDTVLIVLAVVMIAQEYKIYARYRTYYRKLRIPANYGLVVLDIPKEYCTDEALFKVFDSAYPGKVVAAEMVHNMKKILDLKKDYMKAIYTLELMVWKAENGKKRPKKLKCGKGCVDAVDYWTEERERIRTEIEEIQNGPLKESNAGFVLFNSRKDASVASQVVFGNHTKEWKVSHAADWRGVRWQKLCMNQHAAALLRTNSIFWLVFFIICWAAVTAFVMGFASVSALSQLKAFEWLSFINDLPEVVVGIISTFLPVVILIVLNMIPTIVMTMLAGAERLHGQYLCNARIRNYLYVINVFGNYFYILVAGTILANIDVLQDLAGDPTGIVNILAASVPQNAFFFITFITTVALTGVIGNLSQIARVIKMWIFHKFLVKTDRKRDDVDCIGSTFTFHSVYNECTIIALIAFAYTAIFPFICVVAVVYFGLTLFCVKYAACFVTANDSEDGGYLFRGALQHLFFGLYIKMITMIGLLGINRCPVQAALYSIPLVFTMAAHFYLNSMYYKVMKHGSFKQYALTEGSGAQSEKEALLDAGNSQDKADVESAETAEGDDNIMIEGRKAAGVEVDQSIWKDSIPPVYMSLYRHPGIKPLPEFVDPRTSSKIMDDSDHVAVDVERNADADVTAENTAANAVATGAAAPVELGENGDTVAPVAPQES